jgi:nucleotide-binding universal stress UspA family protein
MYNKVVIPLDGSKLAETALPHLEEIAKACNIPEILLVSVTEPIHGVLLAKDEFEQALKDSKNNLSIQTGSVHTGTIYSASTSALRDTPVTLGKMGKTALNYLNKISQRLERKGLQTRVNVLVGNPAEEIVRFVEDQNADLVVMASRGKSGFSRWDMGHIAEKVIRATKVPVMLVKPEAGFKETKPKRKGTPA